MTGLAYVCVCLCVCMAHLSVECTDVQGCVSRSVLNTHVCSVGQQMFQVLHVSIPTGLGQQTDNRVY